MIDKKERSLISSHTIFYALIYAFLFMFCMIFSENKVNAKTPDEMNNVMTQGDRITLYFQNIDLRTLLELIAKTSKMNFIISDAVKGSITVHLTNVTWRQALDSILEARGLTSRRIASTVFIS